MPSKKEKKLEIGQTVHWWRRDSQYSGDRDYGEITKITEAGGVTVRPDNGSKEVTFRSRKYE